MSSVPTVVLQLTTTFTAPAECFNTPWVVNNVPTTWWKVGGDLVASCFPPAFPFSISSILYSPGICPAGWTSACQRQATLSGARQNIVSCCPSYVLRMTPATPVVDHLIIDPQVLPMQIDTKRAAPMGKKLWLCITVSF
jgi:hypothetical protein